jgi:hypothetical protein
MGKLKDYIADKYLTWKTGKDKSTRDWEAWYEGKVNYRAGDITNMFDQFKHIIVVDPNLFFQFDPFAWVPCENAKQYLHPNRELGNNAVWRFERVTWSEWDRRWHIDSLCGEDKVFVATNNDKDAIMIALKYAG